MTLVPVPSSDAAIEPDWLSRCAKYFPVVGIAIGLASAVVLLLADRIWNPVVASLLAVATSIASPARCTKTASPIPLTVLAAARAWKNASPS